jgi:hypothetical protein
MPFLVISPGQVMGVLLGPCSLAYLASALCSTRRFRAIPGSHPKVFLSVITYPLPLLLVLLGAVRVLHLGPSQADDHRRRAACGGAVPDSLPTAADK